MDRVWRRATPCRFIAQAVRQCFALLACVLALSSWAESPAPERATSRFESRFMEDMIDHHAMAVQMSQLCLDRAIQDELKTLCSQISSAQQKEIAALQTWLQSWYGISSQTDMRNMKQVEKLATLSGAEFEVAFMRMMIRHHRAAIVEASQCTDRAYHEELDQLCENIIVTQAAEIQKMRTWLCQWYGRCLGLRRELQD